MNTTDRYRRHCQRKRAIDLALRAIPDRAHLSESREALRLARDTDAASAEATGDRVEMLRIMERARHANEIAAALLRTCAAWPGIDRAAHNLALDAVYAAHDPADDLGLAVEIRAQKASV